MAEEKELSRIKTAKQRKPALASKKLATEKTILSQEEQRRLDLNLLGAIRNGRLGEARRLVALGADIEATDSSGWTGLMTAAWNGQTGICRFLLEKGANANARNTNPRNSFYSHTALMRAAMNAKTETCRLLIRSGADISIENKGKRTALMLAENRNDAEIAGILNYYEYYSKKHYFKKLHDS